MRKRLQDLCVFIIVIIVQNGSANEETCTTPDALLGTCILLQDCTFIQKTLEHTATASTRNQLLHSYHCGFDGSLPKVCCPPNYPIATSATSTEEPDDALRDISTHKNLKLLDLTKCGIYNYDKLFRGDQADPYSFPWMALISYKSRSGLSFRCSGTLINQNYILTAAHCITGITSIKLAGVRLGEYNILTDPDCYFEAGQEYCSPPVQDFAIGEIIPHPNYNTTNYGHDIGLIRLDKPAVLTVDYVRPICLPTKQNDDFKADTHALVTGWGVTETGYSSPRLLKVRLPVITNAQCQERYNAIKAPVKIGVGQVCAGGVSGKDTCAGDGGGPLGSANSGDGRFTQYGIVSFGSRFCGLESLPGVYTKVARYMNWILDNIRP